LGGREFDIIRPVSKQPFPLELEPGILEFPPDLADPSLRQIEHFGDFFGPLEERDSLCGVSLSQ
jgi:hypothetical protein